MSDMDRYGLFALAVVILLILFVSMGDLEMADDDGDSTIISLLEEPNSAPAPAEIGSVEKRSAEKRSPDSYSINTVKKQREGFDFTENPVEIPGVKPEAPRRREEARRRETARDSAAPRGPVLLHKVRNGETLSSIAKKYYGSANWWQHISNANNRLDPYRLREGQIIRVPKTPPLKASRESASDGRTKGGRKHPGLPVNYTIRKNDTLAGISHRYYGTENRWREIYLANKDKIADPNVLKPGVRLHIPK